MKNKTKLVNSIPLYLEKRILNAIEKDFKYLVEDFDYSINQPISYLVKTILSIANREKDIKIFVMRKDTKKSSIDLQTK